MAYENNDGCGGCVNLLLFVLLVFLLLSFSSKVAFLVLKRHIEVTTNGVKTILSKSQRQIFIFPANKMHINKETNTFVRITKGQMKER